mmetsp:Transcript_12834/g.10965  ORF Transcript_12834/g.10965 Transcript_12834/m.10965 type:complete len:120 (-) Transcript_12834:186-545(-)
MLSKTIKTFKPFLSHSFSTAIHSPICVIGSGAAGINVCSQMIREGIPRTDIRIFDPAQIHYYQPGWTMVGGGLIEPKKVMSTNFEMIPRGVQWTMNKVAEIDADKNELRTDNDVRYSYD